MQIWETVKGFLMGLYDKFNDFLASSLEIDNRLIELYREVIAPIPEIIKIVGIFFVGIIFVLGVLSFVKKMLKLFVVLAIILFIVLALTQLST
jgi:type IV secretory pathway VirB2 component (pilin)